MNLAPWYRIRRILLDPVAWSLSQRELRRRMRHTELDSIITSADSYLGRGFYSSIRAVQAYPEIHALASLVQEVRPRVIVEIGTYKGGTLYIWCRSNPQAELIVSIDLPGGRYGGGYNRRRSRLYKEFLFDRPNTELTLLRSDSHSPKTIEMLVASLNGRPIDFLYIDGDHTYEGVRADYNMYSPFVRKGGLIAFHDICTAGHDSGVSRLWSELAKMHEHREFVDASANKGIGVIYADGTCVADRCVPGR